jgi:Zn-dependent protease
LSQNDPYPEPRSGQYIPPPQPPQYHAGSDIPPSSPYHYTAAPARNGRGALGWLGSAAVAVVAFLKYGLVLLFKIPAFATLLSALLSVGVYSQILGGWTIAITLVVMIFVHEMGHVVEIRRQGMAATAPIFIPLVGAAIFQREHPTTAVKQAQIGIAGPIAGTLGATVAFVLYGATQNPTFLLGALIGFGLNLLNMIPVWQLDGAWVLAPVSPWFQVAGLAAIALLAVVFHFVSVLLIFIAILGVGSARAAFRNARNPYYASVPTGTRLALFAAWLALVLYLGVMTLQTEGLLTALAR